MAKFTWGKVIEVFDYNLDGAKIEITKFHPWKRGDNGSVLTGEPDLGVVTFDCGELAEQSNKIEYLLLSWIARKNLGLNQHNLVAGVARALGVSV